MLKDLLYNSVLENNSGSLYFVQLLQPDRIFPSLKFKKSVSCNTEEAATPGADNDALLPFTIVLCK